MGILSKAAFIDRDGVINEDLGYVHRIADFNILPGVEDGLARLAAVGYRIVVVSNQAGIGRGMYKEADFERLTQHMKESLLHSGVVIDSVYHCPHHPLYARGALKMECDCRKPRPGMLLRAARDLDLDMSRSVLVGDKRSDIEAGRAAGLLANILVASGHAFLEQDEDIADYVCADLDAASKWIVGHDTRLAKAAIKTVHML